MDKQKIISAILEAEKTLESLRQKLNEPEKPQPLASFKVGDVFLSKRGTTPIIVMEKLVSVDKFYHLCGKDSHNKGYLSSYSDCGKGFTFEQMLDYLNERIKNDWQLIGNISEKFDLMIKEMMNKS